MLMAAEWKRCVEPPYFCCTGVMAGVRSIGWLTLLFESDVGPRVCYSTEDYRIPELECDEFTPRPDDWFVF